MSQTSYALDHSEAIAGMLADTGPWDVTSYPANEDIPAGRLVVLRSDGKIELPQSTSLTKVVGVSVYRASKSPGVYAAGEMVPVLRSGRAIVSVTGSAPAALVDANVNHSSSSSTDRGKLTTSATVGTAGSEVSPAGCVFKEASDSGLAIVEVDFMGRGKRAPDAPVVLSFTAGDTAPAEIKNGQIYELNTTAANSTVSLPAAAPDGTVAYFIADGTKNGHTLTFRDVSTNISAATTASKRVAATAVKAAGKWAVHLTVGP